jgi:hypothetical protein
MKASASYLNDHLAGAVAALELLADLIEGHKDQPLEKFFVDLRRGIEADVEVLRKLIGTMGVRESVVRKTVAWIAGKFASLKFTGAGEKIGGLGLVQALETLALGIRGKQLLWRSLAASDWPAPQGVDLAQLEARAIEQQDRVEVKRLDAVRQAFRST